MSDPRVGLIFMVPGVDEAVRIKGTATLSVNPSLIDSFTPDGMAPPATVILINVVEAYVQNARAIRTAQLWDASTYADARNLPDSAMLSNNVDHQSPQP